MATSAAESARLLLCQVGSLVCALPLEHVAETMRALPVEPIAGLPAFVSGVSIIRGAAVPVVDLATLLGEGSTKSLARLVLVRAEARLIALAVNEVLAIRRLESDSIAALPPLLRGTSTRFLSAAGALDAELLLIIEAGRIVPDSAWARLLEHRESA